MKNFRDLAVWEKAHRLVLEIYRETRSFPDEEKYGLTSQIRRSSASVPTNIAEGCGRRGDRELARYCDIAMGSASEMEYQLCLALDLGYLPPEVHKQLESKTQEVRRMLNAFLKRLRNEP